MAKHEKNRRRRNSRRSAAELPGGFEKGEFGWKSRRRRKGTRDLFASARVCRQARERLELVFAGEIADPLLLGLEVIDVIEMLPGSLTVWVRCPDELGTDLLESRLARAHGFLRSEVGEAINRRRVPDLRFIAREV